MKLSIKIFLPVIIVIHTALWYVAFLVLLKNDIFGLYNNGFLGLVLSRQGEYYSSLMMVLIVFNILLATRAKFLERIFSGLDKVYVAHRYSGYLILILLLLHFFTIKNGILPTGFFKYSLFIANPLFYTFLASIFISVLPNIPIIKNILNIPYNIWKYTHYVMGVIFLGGVYHSIGVSGFVFSNEILAPYMFLIYSIGFIALMYKYFLYKFLKRKYKYIIKERRSLGSGQIVEIILSPKTEKEKMIWKAGQFALFKFMKDGLKEIHPFTISNSYNEKGEVRISMKSLGDWTKEFTENISVDNIEVLIDGPYGEFNSNKEKKDLEIWVAGGIGVTPFLAMLEDYKKENISNKEIIFVWTVKDILEAVYKEEIEKGLPANIEFILHDFSKNGFFKFESLENKIHQKLSGKKLQDVEVYLCGPEAMRNAVIKDAKKINIKNINFEEFKFR